MEVNSPFTSSMLGTRGRCWAAWRTDRTAGFCATLCSLASHLNHLRTAASARAALALVSPRSYSRPRYARYGGPRRLRSFPARRGPRADTPRNSAPRAHRPAPYARTHCADSANIARKSAASVSSSLARRLHTRPTRIASAVEMVPASCSSVPCTLFPTLCSLPPPSPRMVFAVNPLQVLHRDVSVDLRSGDVGVAQQPLHAAQVGPVFHHVGGATVAQHVRTGFVTASITRLPDADRTISHTHWRVSGRPRTLKNKARQCTVRGRAPMRGGLPSHIHRAPRRLCAPTGRCAPRSPLPRTWARAWSRCRSSSPSATISPTRRPPA